MKAGLLLLALAGLGSCATWPFPRHEGVLWVPVPAKASFHIVDLSISTKPTTGDLKQMALDLAVTAAHKAGVALDSETGPRFDLTLSLEEREVGLDIDTYNSVSLVLKVWMPGTQAQLVGQRTYALETKKTLRSAIYLAEALDAVFAGLAAQLGEPQ